MKGTHRIRPLATLIAGVGFVLPLLLLTVYRAWGTSPAITKQQATLSESYTLTLTANPDVTAICRGKQVAFTASLRCTDPYGVATNETVRINVVSGSGADVSGYGSVSTSVTGIQHGKDKIAVTATGDGLSRSRSIDVINVAIESGATSCVHKANAQLEIDTTQSYSPGDGYGWFVALDEGLCTTTVTGETFTYYPTNSKPGIYTVTAKSVTLPACQDSCTVHVVKVDLAVAGVVSTNKNVAPGGLICVTNGPGQMATRTALTINKCEPSDWEGSVELLWIAGNVKVYNAAIEGVEVTSGTTFANAALPTSLWVEGTAASAAAGDIVFRLNPVGIECPQAVEGCDRVVMTAVKVEFKEDANQAYGFDCVGPWISVETGKTTTVIAYVEPSELHSKVYFKSSDESNITPINMVASPQILILTAKNTKGDKGVIEAKLGSIEGENCAILRTAVYEKQSMSCYLHKINGYNGTVSLAQINDILKQAVVRIDQFAMDERDCDLSAGYPYDVDLSKDEHYLLADTGLSVGFEDIFLIPTPGKIRDEENYIRFGFYCADPIAGRHWYIVTEDAFPFPHILAHELFHHWQLDHEQSEDNLMEASATGKRLKKHQWDLAH